MSPKAGFSLLLGNACLGPLIAMVALILLYFNIRVFLLFEGPLIHQGLEVR